MSDEWVGTPRDLTQGTNEWKSARKMRLGASEIASVLRISPYKTRLQLWEEKVGRRFSPDISRMPHVKRGIDAEPEARRLLSSIMNCDYKTPVLVHPEHPWMVASLDGLGDDHVLEIKTMGVDKHRQVARGVIPDYYECQVRWQMMVAGVGRGCLASYRPEDRTLYWHWIVKEPVWEIYAMDEAVKFWKHVTDETQPGDDLELAL